MTVDHDGQRRGVCGTRLRATSYPLQEMGEAEHFGRYGPTVDQSDVLLTSEKNGSAERVMKVCTNLFLRQTVLEIKLIEHV